MCTDNNICLPFYHSTDKEIQGIQENSNIDKNEEEEESASTDSDDFFDAEDEPSVPIPVITSPSLAVPIGEGEPSDIEDAEDYDEQDDISSKEYLVIPPLAPPSCPTPSYFIIMLKIFPYMYM